MSANAINMHPERAFNIEHYKVGSESQEEDDRNNHYLPKDLPPISGIGRPNNVNMNSWRNENETLFDMSNSKQQRSGNLM